WQVWLGHGSGRKQGGAVGAACRPMTRAVGLILLVYDGECPLCNAYCRATRIRESVGTLKLIDARHSSDVRDELTRNGLDMDQGMALKVGDVLYYGSDA